MDSSQISRRDFICRSGAFAAGAGLAAWGAPAFAAPANDRIGLGFIGVGAMGRAHLDALLTHPGVHAVAAADPDGERLAAARDRAARDGVNLDVCRDFREILARADIDAVFVCTPDHWHAPAAVMAMKAGKDVYVEKPLARSTEEGLRIVETARRLGRVVQVGLQQRSDPLFQCACEYVRSGALGDVRLVRAFIGPNPCVPFAPDERVPAHLDWNLWLGDAPRRPFSRALHPFQWRYCRDFSGGLLADWGVHLLDVARWGCDKEDEPVRVEAEGSPHPRGPSDFPRCMRARWDYGDVVFEWVQDTGPALEAIEPGAGYGTKFYGTQGDLFINRGNYRIYSKRSPLPRAALQPEPAFDACAHHRDDFFACVRTRRAPVCDASTGHRSTALCHLANAALLSATKRRTSEA